MQRSTNTDLKKSTRRTQEKKSNRETNLHDKHRRVSDKNMYVVYINKIAKNSRNAIRV